jgi:hypothetical protein
MFKFSWSTACFLLFSSFCFSQTADKNGWGPWRYTDFKVSGIEFRTKCLSTLGADSKWGYQFRSRHDSETDFVEREEHGVKGSSENGWNTPRAFTLGEGEMSSVLETQLHGTCARIRELRIEVVCDVELGVYPNDPCFLNADGELLELKTFPKDNP